MDSQRIWLQLSQKWNRACGKWFARLISYLKSTSGHRQSCHVRDRASECKPGLFHDADTAGDVTDLTSTSGRTVPAHEHWPFIQCKHCNTKLILRICYCFCRKLMLNVDDPKWDEIGSQPNLENKMLQQERQTIRWQLVHSSEARDRWRYNTPRQHPELRLALKERPSAPSQHAEHDATYRRGQAPDAETTTDHGHHPHHRGGDP